MVDPYPLAIRRADGRVVVEEIGGDAWSGTIDLSGQFTTLLLTERSVLVILVALLCVPLAIRLRTALSARSRTQTEITAYHEDTKGTKITKPSCT